MNQIISIIFILLLHSLQTTPLQTTSVCGEPVTEIKSCVTNIRQQPLLYESCKARPCFVFTGQPPHVLLGDSISPLPFQCGNSQLANLSIDGTVFRIMNVTEIGKELCIYSAYCSISQLISWSYFMAQYGYQFVVVNMLMDLPERRCHHSPSIGFYTDELVIVSRKKSRIFEMISSAWENVSKCIGYLVLSMLPIFSFLYMRKRWERTGITPTKNRNERNGQLWINVRFASSIYLFAVLLSLELLFVNWTNRGEERHRPLSIMAKMEVSKFAVPAGTGIETIFKLRVLPSLSNTAQGNPSWFHCRNELHCIQMLANESHPVQYVIATRKTAEYMVNRDSHDPEIIELLELPAIYRFSSGWLYNNAVHIDFRRSFDSEMISLRISGMVNQILDSFLSDL